jgi:hypothetical protein
MSASSQPIVASENPFLRALWLSCAVFTLLIATTLHILGVSLVFLIVSFTAVALLGLVFRYPMAGLGAVLVFMPIYPVAILVAKFFGPSFMMSDAVTALDRVALLLVTLSLLWRNGIKLKTPDWFLLAAFALALIRFAFGGTLFPVLYDFDFIIAYAAGRVAVLTLEQQQRWASRGVWIVAILSVVGLFEVFLFGPEPRAVLYSVVKDAVTEGQVLNGTFRAEGFTGLRESSTMIGPLQFASLCMVGLIVWWVYRRDWLTGAGIAIGLVCSVTRSAWLGTAVAIPVLAIIMSQKKRLLICIALALSVFIASIPVMGIKDYLAATRSGDDPSAQGHQDSLLAGLDYTLKHPLGSGPGNVGAFASVFVENSYLTIAGEYGIPAAFCFMAFMFTALRLAWRTRTPLGFVAVGVIVGFGTVMMVSPLHDVFSLAAWIWFPVGLLVRYQ